MNVGLDVFKRATAVGIDVLPNELVPPVIRIVLLVNMLSSKE